MGSVRWIKDDVKRCPLVGINKDNCPHPPEPDYFMAGMLATLREDDDYPIGKKVEEEKKQWDCDDCEYYCNGVCRKNCQKCIWYEDDECAIVKISRKGKK